MANADRRSPERKEAEQIWLESNGTMKLADIAEKLKVTASKVRKWKATDKWDSKLRPAEKVSEYKKKQVERTTKKVERKQAAGKVERSTKKADTTISLRVSRRGAPKGSQNALKHGGYSAIYWDTLDDDEREMIETMPKDEEEMLLDQIYLFSVRERRILKAIKLYRNGETLSVASVQRTEEKRSFKNEEDKAIYEERIAEKVEKGDRLPGDRYQVTTNTENKDSAIARLEKELSVIQSKKTQAIQALANLRIERAKLNGEAEKDDLVTAWIAGLTGGE